MKKHISSLCQAMILVLVWQIPALATPGPEWNYQDQSWAQIKDSSTRPTPLNYPYATCGIGLHQSPVNITGQAATTRLNRPNPRFMPGAPVFYNSGHAAQVNMEQGYSGGVAIGKDFYPLIQFHFHSPSEHTINGQSFDAELHFVNIRDDGKAAVLTSLISVGAFNKEFQKVLDNFPKSGGEKNENSGVRLNPALLLPFNRRQFFTYAGSLTTPPCSEGINFYVLSQPITISADQLVALRAIYSNNNRVPQPLNGRIITSSTRTGSSQ